MIRNLPEYSRQIFLTFDDGPNGESTGRVLEVLRKYSVPATFFLVGQDIRKQERIVRQIVAEGHALGNHSWDHLYNNYFTNGGGMSEWIGRVNLELAELGLPKSCGFRPPAGVVTPPLLRVLGEMNEPLVMWSERFFDTVFPWTRARAERSARRLSGGSIVLLHDGQKPDRVSGFCDTLGFYIESLRSRGFEFATLSRELCLSATSGRRS